MKTEIVKIPRRFETKHDRTQGIIRWDRDNAYAERCNRLAEGSVTASSCIDLFKRFVAGEGFEDKDFGDAIINGQGWTMNDLLEGISEQVAKHRGYCVHVNYNALLEEEEYQIIEFHETRKTDSTRPNEIAVYDDWSKTKRKAVDKKRIKYFKLHTDNKETLASYIEEAGGFVKFEGTVFWFSYAQTKYPLPIYAPALESIETEANADVFKRRNVTTGFLASHIAKFRAQLTPEEKELYKQGFEEFQGSENASKFMILDGVGDEEDNNFVLDTVDQQDNDDIFQYSEESAAEKIRRSFLAPPILIGMHESTGFDTQRLQQARAYYNSVTLLDRQKVERSVEKLVQGFKVVLNTTGNYKITELFNDANLDQEVNDG